MTTAAPPAFGLVYSDPPWHYSWNGCTGHIQGRYRTGTLDDHVREIQLLALKPAALHFMWATWPHLSNAFWILQQTGFSFGGVHFVWQKLNARLKTPCSGLGSYTLGNTELLLVGVRGFVPFVAASRRISTVREKHSQKPLAVRSAVGNIGTELNLGSMMEMYARNTADVRFSYHGDQMGQEVTPPDPKRPRVRGRVEFRLASVPVPSVSGPVQQKIGAETQSLFILVINPFDVLGIKLGPKTQLVMVRATCFTLPQTIAAIDAMGFMYKTLGFYAYDAADETFSEFWLVGVKPGSKLRDVKQKMVGQCVLVSDAHKKDLAERAEPVWEVFRAAFRNAEKIIL